MSSNRVSSGNKTKLSQNFLTLKAPAAHPVLCYWFSMTSTSSKAGINLMLVNKLGQIFEYMLDPSWQLVFSHFDTANLHLFQTHLFS